MGLSPLTRIVTNLERHLLSLSNRDFAARAHPAFAEELEDFVMGELVTGFERHDRSCYDDGGLRASGGDQRERGAGGCDMIRDEGCLTRLLEPRVATS